MNRLLSVVFALVLLPWETWAYRTIEEIREETRYVKGHLGERLIDEFYARSGRTEILGKLLPSDTGPDRIFSLRNGVLEVHEVKFHDDWPGKGALKKEVNHVKMEQLSDRWLKEWIGRVRSRPLSSPKELAAAARVEQAIANGSLLRVYDEFNASTGQFRSSIALPKGDIEVELKALQGPLRVSKYLAKCTDIRNELGKLGGIKPGCFQEPRLAKLGVKPKGFQDYGSLAAELGMTRTSVHAGALLPDGRLLVAFRAGAESGILIFAIEAGTATYEYFKGDSLKPEYERKLTDAAVKGLTVGTVTAVAVSLAVAPGGFVLVGIATGAYVLTDSALRQWHEAQARRFLNRSDLAHFGIELQSPLEITPVSPLILKPVSPLDIRPVSPLDIKPTSPLDVRPPNRIK